MEIGKVYSLEQAPDRRQQNIPVEHDRRSGVDRRKAPRCIVTSKIRQEILESKGEKTDLAKLYNLEYLADRRKQEVSVEDERRCGYDRRKAARLAIDPKIKQDLSAFKPKLKIVNHSDSYTNSEGKGNDSAPISFTGGAALGKIMSDGISQLSQVISKTNFSKPNLASYLKSVTSILSVKAIDLAIVSSSDKKQALKATVASVSRISGCVAAATLAYCFIPQVSAVPALVPGVISGIVGAISGNELAKFINNRIK